MFDLSAVDLTGRRVLDCPGGGASFVAEAAARGIDATAVDPAYAPPQDRLAEHVRREVERGHAFLLDPDRFGRFVWTWFSAPEHHLAVRRVAAARFAVDLPARPQRYLPAALPRLPFPDASFDLVLSSHLLFTYAERLDEAFHLAALAELARVARGEVRVFPLLQHTDGRRYAGLDRLRAALADTGVRTQLRRVPYEFQRGGDEMLVLHHRDEGFPPEQHGFRPLPRRGPAVSDAVIDQLRDDEPE